MREGCRIKIIRRFLAILIVVFLLLLFALNPDRGSFNNAVFEGGPDPFMAGHSVTEEIIEINRKDYNNDNHPYVIRKNYILCSIYDVRSGSKTYHILGVLNKFRLISENR